MTTNENTLTNPNPACLQGYPEDQLREILGTEYPEFMLWMRGQTMSICDGRRYDHEAKAYHDSDCGPHGTVVYPWDLARYLHGRPVID